MNTRTYSPTLTSSLTPSVTPTRTLTYTKSPTYTMTPTPHLPLYLNKNYFNPTGETLEILMLAEVSGPISVNVYNLVGEKVRHIADLNAIKGSPSTFTWNGTNDSGEYLGNGVYIIMLKSNAGVHLKKVIILK